MKKGLTELVFILDRSGSMAGLEKDTIGGFNGMIQKQKQEPGEANVTTVLFDNRYEVIHDRFPIGIMKPMTEKEYYVRGCTALLDAIGKTVSKIDRVQSYLPVEMRAEKVIFVITTDGLENASRQYDYKQIKRMIRQKSEEEGWEFLFLGANMDAVSEAEKFGIEEEHSVTFENDSEGIELNYRAVGKALSSMRSAPTMHHIDRSWKAEIEEDYLRRGDGNREKQ